MNYVVGSNAHRLLHSVRVSTTWDRKALIFPIKEGEYTRDGTGRSGPYTLLSL